VKVRREKEETPKLFAVDLSEDSKEFRKQFLHFYLLARGEEGGTFICEGLEREYRIAKKLRVRER